MRIALAQINSRLGDFDYNLEKILNFVRQANEDKADLVVFPELALFGYSPQDLLERPDVVQQQLRAFKKIKSTKAAIAVGLVTEASSKSDKPFHNSMALVQKNRGQFFHKELLPSYDVFDETRFFEPGRIQDHMVTLKGQKILFLICEDIWGWEKKNNPLKKWKGARPDLVISINASPFTIGKALRREKVVSQTAQLFRCPVYYVNMVGAQDEVIFDGSSFVSNAKGKVVARLPSFSEDLKVVDSDELDSKALPRSLSPVEKLRGALVLGLRDFAQKNGLGKMHLGLSGGIDSALALCLAAEAIGAENVTAIAMPGPYSASESLKLAEQLAKNIGCTFHQVPIGPIYEKQLQEFEAVFGKQKFGLLHENLQARIRGGILMMFSNLHNSLLLATSNKSEMATGYATLYGDMCGGIAPLADLLKRQVYALSLAYNQERELIPERIIDRPPSAELRPDQKDQDSLPEYDLLDRTVEKLVEKKKKASTDTEHWLLKKIAYSEFKRWQAPPVLKISDHAFGRGRRWPISHQLYKK